MFLQEQLTQLKEVNLAKFPEEIKIIIFADLAKLSESGIVEASPKTGDTLKDFTLPNNCGEVSSLA